MMLSRPIRCLTLLGALGAMLGGSVIAAPPAARPDAVAAATAPDEVFYQIFVRSFYDSNGDRIGDLRGIQEKIGYLQQLGITSVLLTPIQPSPMYHNYFATSFEGVDPAYGTLHDLHALTRALHARGMKLYLDEEVQYVATGHPWLDSSLGRSGSPYSRYVAYDGPGNTDPETGFWNVFETPVYPGRKVGIAVVNLKNPAVRRYFERNFVSWVDPHGDGSRRDGVDGFRIDHMMDNLDNKGKQTNLFADFWAPIFARVRAVDPQVRIIAEQADWGYGTDWLRRGGVDRVFAFPIRFAVVRLDKAAIEKAIRGTAANTPPGKGQITFIENHDMNRFASEVGGDRRKEEIGAAFTVLLKGAPLIYYGQEIGMRGRQSLAWGTDANDIPDREAFRWQRSLEAPGSAIWYRGDHPWWMQRYNRSNDGVSVAEETGDPHSLLSYYRALLHLRATRRELQAGDETLLPIADPHVIGFVRRLGAARTLVVINLGAAPATVDLGSAIGPSPAGGWRTLLAPRNSAAVAPLVRAEMHAAPGTIDPAHLSLPPYAVIVADTGE